MAKVIWPTRKEATITSGMVFVMVISVAVPDLPGSWTRRWHSAFADDSRTGRSDAMAKRWYVVHAYSGFEKKVAQGIREQAAPASQSCSAKSWCRPRKWSKCAGGQSVNAERKFFPGYVLVEDGT